MFCAAQHRPMAIKSQPGQTMANTNRGSGMDLGLRGKVAVAFRASDTASFVRGALVNIGSRDNRVL